MILKLLRYLFNYSEREVRRQRATVERINALEPEIARLTDAELAAKTGIFKERLAKGEPIESLAAEAFAVVREASRRTIGLRHYDVQMIGGLTLFEGKIAEMKTGEGKTLVATLPLYLRALEGRGAHLVTVNDYLARRDSEWMGRIYRFLGLTVGLVVNDLGGAERQAAYRADITYGTNNEFGFDYLRDNMAISDEDIVQRPHYYAIVDEVDSILIDEARTPLIISGPSDKPTRLYYQYASIVPSLARGKDYEVDEKARTVTLTERGIANVERMVNVPNWFDPGNITNVHLLNQALKAHALFKRDVDYVVKDGEILIVDEFTGRLLTGRRYSEGLHQAIEAKEGVEVRRENMTLATITLQNYFRMYKILAGMTGTAETEAKEFFEIYKLRTVVIPPNRTMIRKDHPDVIYKTEREKYKAVVEEILRAHETGQPVLVGTISIENSERLGKMLRNQGVKCEILNAKYHEREAEIVAQAGREGAITIATNMAGRGTDILLGGNPDYMAFEYFRDAGRTRDEVPNDEWNAKVEEFKKITGPEHDRVIAAGGLYILGTERHDARRIDNQLRGRAGRQGDPGESRFFLSLEDDLMRKFGSDRISGIMDKLGMEEDVPIESGLVSRALESAQRRVETRNFEIRKQVLKYDDVMNSQREAIYSQRQELLRSEDLDPELRDMVADTIENVLAAWESTGTYEETRDFDGLVRNAKNVLNVDLGPEHKSLSRDELEELLVERTSAILERKRAELGDETWRRLVKVILLRTLDEQWKDHLTNMHNLEEGIGLRAYGQKDPLVEYRIEGAEMFQAMIDTVKERVTEFLLRVDMVKTEDEKLELKAPDVFYTNRDEGGPAPREVRKRAIDKVSRNAPCPCGSGRKFKQCCGA